MSLRLHIEHSPHRQAVTELSHPGGELSVGRGVEADWRLEDPDMFISRKHCVIAGGEDGFTVTDISRGGLFVDGSDAPLGAGRSCELKDGMRLRLGDVVLRVELRAEAAPVRPFAGDAPRREAGFAADDFFARRAPPEPPTPPRPSTLPDPFDAPRSRVRGTDGGSEPRPAAAPPFDDPFTLDPLPSTQPAPAETDRPSGPPVTQSEADPFGISGSFFGDNQPRRPSPEPQRLGLEPSRPADPEPFGDFFQASAPDRAASEPQSERASVVAVPPRAAAGAEVRQAPGNGASPELSQAFLRGMGLDTSQASGLGPAEMELLGRRFRALVEVLEQSLRSRAREKRNLRVAQTVIGSSNVNPLKFLPTVEDILVAMIAPAKPGYLDADAAIEAAQRDLADHQLRTWSGLQASLRRMIERFDPEAIERDMEAAGKLRKILAGGRSALLWQLYRERYKTMAKAAEDRFLGEVGSDFRDAYEGQGRTDHD